MKLVRLTLVLLSVTSAAAASPLRVNGSTTVNLPVAEAAEILRSEKGLEIQVDTQGGSSGGVSSVGDSLADVGMLSKPLSTADRQKYPKVDFRTVQIGEDAVALVVSRDVWDAGLRSLSAEQVRDVYEGRTKNWKEVGGPDRRIVFFNKEPGRGTWEVFANWLYGEAKKAPPVSHLEVGGNEEGRSKVASTKGAVTQLSSSWADGTTVFALGIREAGGEVILPTGATIASGRYPMSRPLFLVTNGEPGSAAAVLLSFMLGERGQAIVRKHGYLSLAELEGKSPAR